MEYVNLSLESEIRVLCCNVFCLSLTQLIAIGNQSFVPDPSNHYIAAFILGDIFMKTYYTYFDMGIFLLHSFSRFSSVLLGSLCCSVAFPSSCFVGLFLSCLLLYQRIAQFLSRKLPLRLRKRSACKSRCTWAVLALPR